MPGRAFFFLLTGKQPQALLGSAQGHLASPWMVGLGCVVLLKVNLEDFLCTGVPLKMVGERTGNTQSKMKEEEK